jgi:Restriction endonuclease
MIGISMMPSLLIEARKNFQKRKKPKPAGALSSEESDEDEENWKSILLQILTKKLKPDGFERLTQRLLRAAGFKEVKVTGRVGDGGIDGVGILRNGLSVLPKQDKLRRPGPNEHALRIESHRGRSYVVDLSNKASFARHHSTSYEEYGAYLKNFDIDIRVEPQNITYFYPGRTHGKRGKRLKPELDKPGLEEKFAENQERLRNSPELQKTVSQIASRNLALPIEETREHVSTGLIPIEEIQLAKLKSIPAYCEKEKIKLLTDEQGKRVIAGREFVEVSEYGWFNHRNKTRGNMIDFVVNHIVTIKRWQKPVFLFEGRT